MEKILHQKSLVVIITLILSLVGILSLWVDVFSDFSKPIITFVLLLEAVLILMVVNSYHSLKNQWGDLEDSYRAEHRLRLFLQGSLDAVQAPITVTDMNMNWVFINKVTESLLKPLGIDKVSALGKHCSNWKADICGTQSCGIANLRQGCNQTHYNQEYPHQPSTYMQVDVNYILDDDGNQIGHVEIVTNVDAAQKIKTSSEQISSSLERTSASLEEMSAITHQTTENCQKVTQLMDHSSKHVMEAHRLMGLFTNSMNQITAASQETSMIVKTIDEISFQTNILALNAAVEAARAGPAGAGFAVVASEVRNLAMRAAQSSRGTAELIEKTISKVKEGSDLLLKTNESFGEMVKTTDETKDRISHIATASNEQSIGIQAITAAVLDMSNVIDTSITHRSPSKPHNKSRQTHKSGKKVIPIMYQP